MLYELTHTTIRLNLFGVVLFLVYFGITLLWSLFLLASSNMLDFEKEFEEFEGEGLPFKEKIQVILATIVIVLAWPVLSITSMFHKKEEK